MTLSRIAPIAALLACALFVSGCANTVAGGIQDVKATGKAIEEGVE